MKILFKLLGILMMLSNLNYAEAKTQFMIAKTTGDISRLLSDVPKNSIIFIDVDDTIITPVSKTFRVSPYNKIIDDIKNNSRKYHNYEGIVSNWRLQRKVMLIDSDWPKLMSKLKEKFMVYGLTKMDVGKFGNIGSMEEWRYKELISLGIEFSANSDIPKGVINNSVFYNGLFLTGVNSKSQTILNYHHGLNAKNIVMIDDRAEHLEDMMKFCEKNAIGFFGILFNGLEKFKDRPEAEVAAFQKQYLINNAQWLEDEEATKMMAIGAGI